MGNENAAAVAADAPTADQAADAKPGLSDEEKAALAAEDTDQAGAGTAEGDKAGDADNPPQDAAKADSTDAAGAGASPDEPPEIPRGTAATVNLQPSRDVDLEAVNKRLTDLSDLQTDLDQQYDDEKIDAKAYLAQSRDITNETGELNADIREANFVQNANQSLAVKDWQDSVNDFVNVNTEFSTKVMQGALNAALNELYGDEANLGSSHNWYLETAKRAVLEQITPAEAAAENPSDAGDKDPNKQALDAAKGAADKASDAKDKLPKTLGELPAADAAATSQDKFADLDKLEGVELEEKLAKMSPEQADEYLRAG